MHERADAFGRMLEKLADGGLPAQMRDVLLVQFGKRVRLCEYGYFDGAPRVVTVERPVSQVKRLFKELSAHYDIAHVQITGTNL
jgi:hypothetical protein